MRTRGANSRSPQPASCSSVTVGGAGSRWRRRRMYLSPAHVDATPAPQNIWDLSHLLRVAKRRFRLMTTIILVVIAATAVITFTTKPTYTASAQLLIEKPDESLIAKNRPVNDGSVESATIETELEVLRSP